MVPDEGGVTVARSSGVSEGAVSSSRFVAPGDGNAVIRAGRGGEKSRASSVQTAALEGGNAVVRAGRGGEKARSSSSAADPAQAPDENAVVRASGRISRHRDAIDTATGGSTREPKALPPVAEESGSGGQVVWQKRNGTKKFQWTLCRGRRRKRPVSCGLGSADCCRYFGRRRRSPLERRV